VDLLRTGFHQDRAARLGLQLRARLEQLIGHGVVAVGSLELGWTSNQSWGTGRDLCEALTRRGPTIRLAPPIVITDSQLDPGLDQLEPALTDLGRH
jgi:ornithine--oxo-acid transaminase